MNLFRKILYFIRRLIHRIPALEKAYRIRQELRLASGKPIPTPFGFKLLGIPAMQNGQFEPDETQLVKKILLSTEVFINVGANFGYYCCFSLSMGKQTIAFEPMERNLKILYKNLRANGWLNEKIEIFPLALSNEVGLIEIWGGGTGASLIQGWASTPDTYSQLVPVSTLDTILANRFSGNTVFLLVDIEGAEYLMLQGANQLLHRTPKPIWMVEIATTEHQPKGVRLNPYLLSTFELFWEAGYEAWTVDSNPRKITLEDIQAVVSLGKDEFKTHNFIFADQSYSPEIWDSSLS